jgi:hypothetical protein
MRLTAIEYGLMAASIAIGVAVYTTAGSSRSSWGDVDKAKAAKACASRPANTTNVVIKDWLQYEVEYKCSDWPKIFNPTYIGPAYRSR